MAKFSGPGATTGRKTRAAGPLGTQTVGQWTATIQGGLITGLARQPTAFNDEGAPAYAKDPKTELFTAVVSAFATEGSFYESGDDRAKRVRHLVEQIAQTDPRFIANLVPWLRNVAQMRTASIMVAADLAATTNGGGTRSVVNLACQRADEPSELLGYWLATYGRKIPAAVKRGLADACRRLYNERNVIKWDGQSKGVRFADVIELCHPKPVGEWQSKLFGHCLDRRHSRDDAKGGLRDKGLSTLAVAYELDAIPTDARRALLRGNGPVLLADASYTWERLAGWLPGGMDAEAWEAAIPSMGIFALIRNLRNFEQTGISQQAGANVIATITDPDVIAKSRLFPYRFWSAYRNSGSLRYAWALEQATDLACANIPKMGGRTLVLTDVSPSMESTVSGRSAVQNRDVGALFAAAWAKANGAASVDLVAYSTESAIVPIQSSVLRTVERTLSTVRPHGTHTWAAAQRWYAGHDRVLIFTDMDDHPDPHQASLGGIPAHVPVYVWDLRGHSTASIDVGAGRHLFAGFTDTMFRLLPILESGRSLDWDALFAMGGAAADGDG